MPGIPISISSRLNDTIFGDVQGPLAALIRQEYDRYQNGDFVHWPKIFKEFQLKQKNAVFGESTSIGQFEDVGEGGAYPQSEIRDGFKKTLEAEEWKNSFSITQTAVEDMLDFVLKDRSKELIGSYYRTKNAFFWGLLGAALNNTDHVTPKKRKISIKTKDGVNLFSQSHKMANAGGTICNAFSDAFSATALGKAAEKMQNMKDDNGEILGLNPDTIIIPNLEAAKSTVFGVVGAHNDPTTPASNKFNYQFGNWNVLVVPWLAAFQPQSGFNWILMDSTYNETAHGAIDIERIPLNIKSDLAPNDDNEWKGRCRFSGAFYEFRAFVAGGVSFGASL